MLIRSDSTAKNHPITPHWPNFKACPFLPQKTSVLLQKTQRAPKIKSLPAMRLFFLCYNLFAFCSGQLLAKSLGFHQLDTVLCPLTSHFLTFNIFLKCLLKKVDFLNQLINFKILIFLVLTKKFLSRLGLGSTSGSDHTDIPFMDR